MLQERLGLEAAERRPLLGMVSRLAVQKGIDLLIEALPDRFAAARFQPGGAGLRRGALRGILPGAAARSIRRAMHYARGFSEDLSHWIEAASDMFLMPSRYEPCGLNQLYSLRYGTVPIVRRTGGLADSVEHFDEVSGTGTGIVFNDYDTSAVRWALDTALDLYQKKGRWRRLVQNAMAQDFSWQRQVGEYERVYQQLALRVGLNPHDAAALVVMHDADRSSRGCAGCPARPARSARRSPAAPPGAAAAPGARSAASTAAASRRCRRAAWPTTRSTPECSSGPRRRCRNARRHASRTALRPRRTAGGTATARRPTAPASSRRRRAGAASAAGVVR